MADEQLTTRDGRRLHADVRGSGRPTVVFEAGAGCTRSTWASVVPPIARRTRTVAYDRSGLGRSDADRRPRRLARLADDLVDVLRAQDGPSVIVAHSWGGPVARLAALQAPDLVVGLVLVDTTDEWCDRFFLPEVVRRNRIYTGLLVPLARLGLLRRLVSKAAEGLPAEAIAEIRAECGTVDAARAMKAELAWTTEDLAALRDSPPALPDIPVTIITGTKPVKAGAADRTALLDAHRRRAASLPQGRHVEAPGSAHLVMSSEPELVVAEIVRILDQVTPPS